MPKKRKRSLIVKDLDRAFSLYVRNRDANLDGFVECITCGAVKHWKTVDCGHFMSRSRYSTRWDELNAYAQCKKCNMTNGGEQFIMARRIDEIHGEGMAEAIHIKSMTTVKLADFELVEMIEEYRQKLNDLI